MNDESVQVIRESARNFIKFNRQIKRDGQCDIGRDIGPSKNTNKIVAEIGNKLKIKSSITPSDLHILKNAIIDDSKNIEVVLKNHGALRGLVREISGTDVRRQVAAAGCFCNLALGDSRAGVTIAKAVGSYLVAAVDNLSAEIAVICIWTLGNLAGSGTKACDILVAQGALSKLVDILSNTNEDILEAAVYALLHFAHLMKDSLSKEHLYKITRAFSTLKLCTTSSQLLFVLSCHNEFCVDAEHLLRILNFTTVSMEKHINECQNEAVCEFVYLIRTLANICDARTGRFILDYFENEIGVQSVQNIIQGNDSVVTESLLWLLGNVYNNCGDTNFYNLLVLQ